MMKTLKIEIKEEQKLITRKMEVKINIEKLRKEMQKIKKMKTRKEKKLTRKKEIKKTAYLTSTFSDERKYEKFKENFHDSTNGYKKILNIKDIDMKPSIEILDNIAVEGDYEGKYRVLLKPLNLYCFELQEHEY
uniref:Uncharacterized protein n=1 Tax=Lactuca sativa TaxID=4236 RepID=A0A9R1W9Q7_LACSA|nr:hypothetical protein LSAT_V11C200085410 [Lactuca sativa]